jgi:hypothetical protein
MHMQTHIEQPIPYGVPEGLIAGFPIWARNPDDTSGGGGKGKGPKKPSNAKPDKKKKK